MAQDDGLITLRPPELYQGGSVKARGEHHPYGLLAPWCEAHDDDESDDEAKSEPGFVAVSVTDKGPGLDPVVADNLFQPFITTKSTGTGIGLSICKTIVDSHGGRMDVANTPGDGVAFTFTVPVAPVGGLPS